MSASDRVVKLTLDVQTKISDLESSVSKIKQTFNTLKAPEGLTKDVQRAFNDLEERLKKVKDYTKNNEFNLVDQKKITSELKSIEKEYDSLFRNIENNSKKISLNNISKEAEALKKGINQYDDAIKKSTRDIKDQEKVIDRLTKERNKMSDKASAIMAKQEEIDAAQKVVDSLKNEIEYVRLLNEERKKYEDAGRSEKQTEAIINRTKKWKDHAQIEEQVAAATSKLEKAKASLTKQEEKDLATFDKNNNQLKEAETYLKKLQTQLDNLKASELEKVKQSLLQLQQKGDIKLDFDPNAIKTAEQLEAELKKIDGENFEKVRGAILNFVDTLKRGKQESREMGSTIDQTGEKAREFGDELDRFKQRVIYFFGLDNAVRLFQRALRATFETVKDLDAVMTETAVVTNFDVGDMWSQLPEYTQRANELGVSIHDAYEAATLYYQQGLSTNEVMAVSNETLKMARIAGLDAADATDRMTNALRGFNMEITEANAQNINDVYSNLAAKTASNVDEISTAMTKVASLAHNANMSFENTAAFLSQIIETTRESAETAGTALKTVVARFSEVKSLYTKGELLGTDSEGEAIDVNKVSKALRTAGIDLNEYLTGMKGLDDIFMELSAKWDNLDQVQQRYIATMAAGSRQQSRFIALMQDYSRMVELVGEANDAAGASQKQFEKTLESLRTKINQLKNAWNTFLMGIANSDAIKVAVDALTALISVVNKLTAGLPGLLKSFANISIAIGTFSLGKNIFSPLVKNIGPLFLGKGKEASENFANGFSTTLKNVFSKDFWSKTFSGAPIIDNKAARESIVLLTEAQAAVSVNDVAVKNLAQAEAVLAAEKLNVDLVIDEETVDMAELATATAGVTNAEIALASAQTASIAPAAAKEAAIKKLGISEAEYTMLQEMGIPVEYQAVALEMMHSGALFGLSAAQAKAVVMNKVRLMQMKALIANLMAEAAATILNAYSKTKLVFADKAAGLATKLLSGEIFTNTQLILISTGVIAGLVAVLGLLYLAIKAIADSSLDSRLEKAEQASEDLAAKASDATNAYKDLKSSIEELDEKYATIENLTEGTREWRDAVSEVNEKVLELVNNYDGLEVSIENGVLKITNEEEVQSQYAQKAQEATYQSIAAKQTVTNLQVSSDYNNLKERSRAYVDNNGIRENDFQATKELAKALTGDASILEKYGVTAKSADESVLDFTERLAEAMGVQFNATEKSVQELIAYGEAVKDAESATRNYSKIMGATAAEYAGLEGTEATRAANYLNTTQKVDDLSIEEAEKVINDFQEKFNNIEDTNLQEAFGKALEGSGELSFDQLDSLFEGVFSEKGLAQKFSEYLGGEESDYNKIASQLAGEYRRKSQIKGKFEDKGIEFGDVSQYSRTTLEGLTSQIENLSEQNAKDYIDSFNNTIEKAPKESQEGLGNYLSGVKWSNTKETLEALDYMKENGLESDAIFEFWENASKGVQLYIEDVTEATLIQSNLNEELNGIIDLEDKLKEGKATSEELKKLTDAGYDVSQLQLTKDGWKGTEEQIKEATNALRDYNIEKTKIALSGAGGEEREILQQQLDYSMGSRYTAEENYLRGGSEKSVQFSAENEVEKLGGDITEYQDYVQAIKNVNTELTNMQAIMVALGNTKLNVGIGELIDSYKEWSELIDKTTGAIVANTSEDIASFNKMKKSVMTMLDVTDDLSDKFWVDSKNVENLKAIATQSDNAKQALEDLQKAAALDYLDVQLDADPTLAKEAVEDFKNYLSNYDIEDLEVGAQLEDDAFIDACNELITAAGLTTDQVAEIFKSLGFDVEFEMDYGSVDGQITIPMVQMESPDGLGSLIPEIGQRVANYSGAVPLPAIKSLTSKGAGGGGISKGNKSKGSGGKGGGGGGGGGGKKPSYWKNPYDELYNLQEKINEALRTRELLERKYQKLLKSNLASITQIRNDYYAQIKAMREEIKLQEQMQAGRLKQIQKIGQEIYTDDEGNRSTFSSLGVTKYASYNAQTGLITIDWEGLDAISKNANREAEGKAAEAYISKLEELVEKYEEVRDAIWDIEDSIDDLTQEAIDSYLSFEERVMDAVIQQYEKEIDAFENMSNAIDDASGKVLDGIQKQIDEERQARENDKTEQELEEKEARLAYLRRDTSGANDLEILQLEKEIQEARQNYQDSLIDQAISQMQEDADLAAEQRATQIEVMRSQLELSQQNGDLWQEVYGLINRATGESGSLNMNSDLVNLLKDTEAFDAMSAFGQDEWIKALVEEFNKAEEGIAAGEAEKSGDHEGTAKPVEPVIQTPTPAPAAEPEKPKPAATTQTTPELTDDIKRRVAAAIWNGRNYGGWGSGSTRSSRLTEVFGPNNGIQALVNQGVGKNGVSYSGHTYEEMRKRFKGYKEGGLADFTGPAWLDGTKSKPEAVLNADDTRNLITLKNILAQLIGGSGSAPLNFGGDNYYDIDITAEIGSDYDVDRLTERVKKQILDDGQYRNVNNISYLR